jgi:hypothetical protein
MPLTCCGTAVSWADDALPPTTCARLAVLFGLDVLPDTLREAAAAVETPDDGPSPTDAVAPDATGDHEVWADGDRLELPAFADALAVADVGSAAVAVHSADPVTGVPVSLRLDEDPTAHSTDPPGAVVSLGVAPAVPRRPPSTRPREAVRDALAPTVHLFTGRRTFRRFEAASETPVVALPADDPDHVRALATLLRGFPSDSSPETAPYGRGDPVAVDACLHGPPRDAATAGGPAARRR